MNPDIRRARREAAKRANHRSPALSKDGKTLGPASFKAQFFDVSTSTNADFSQSTRTTLREEFVASHDQTPREQGELFKEYRDYVKGWAKKTKADVILSTSSTSPSSGVGDGFRVRPINADERQWLGVEVKPFEHSLPSTEIRRFNGWGMTEEVMQVSDLPEGFTGRIVSLTHKRFILWAYTPGWGWWKAGVDGQTATSSGNVYVQMVDDSNSLRRVDELKAAA